MAPCMHQLTRAVNSLSLSSPISQPPTVAASLVVPCLHHHPHDLRRPHQRRHASILGSLSDVPASYSKRKRVGRGPASGKGKTSGRGHKGQGQHGGVPWHLRDPERRRELREGQVFVPREDRTQMSLLNVDTIQEWIDKGRLDASRPLTLKELVESRCVHGIRDGIKLLARNATTLRTPIDIVVSRASANAIEAVERAGGSVTTRYYARRSIGHILAGRTSAIASADAIGGPLEALMPMSREVEVEVEVEAGENNTEAVEANITSRTKVVHDLPPFKYRLADPVARKAREYYRNPANRGYLVHTVRRGEGPSLFFRPPAKIKAKTGSRDRAVTAATETGRKDAVSGSASISDMTLPPSQQQQQQQEQTAKKGRQLESNKLF